MEPGPRAYRTLRAGLGADARRGVLALSGAVIAVGVVELIATMVAYTGPLRFGAVMRLIPLDATLLAFAWTILLPIAMLAFAAPRLATWLARGEARARALAGPGARPIPGVWIARGWALVWAGAAFAYWSSNATFRASQVYKEPRLMGMMLAFQQLVVVAGLLVVAALLAHLLDRVRAWSEPKLGRAAVFSPLSRAAPALLLAGGAVCAVLAILGHRLVVFRPLIPWRLLLSVGAAITGAGGALVLARLRGPVLGRDRTRRRWRVGLAAGALVIVPMTLVRCGADGDTKGMAISASPLLDKLIERVRTVNDLDRDGFGSLLGENDCAPFDRKIHPGARDVPDDGVDQNCHDGDSSMRDLVAPTGEKMEVPDAFRGQDWNVLLITVDTVRYDHTSFGGYRDGPKARDTTPRLAELVDQSVSFNWAQAPSAGTMASVPAILTSKFFHSGIALDEKRKPKMPPKLKAENTTLPEIMKRGGYTTGTILSHEYFNAWGMEQGVDDYDNAIGKKPDPFRVSSDQSTDRAIAWVSRHPRDKWFLWVHYLDPHGRYVAHPDEVSYGTSEEDLYDGELRFTDTHLGRLFKQLSRLPGAERTIIIITSDHGDAFNEHGFTNHGQALYRELLHVPLIFYVPDLPAREVGGAVSPMDIVPTIADLCGIDVSDLTFEGRSLVPQIFYGKADEDRVVFAETNYPKPLRAAVSTKYKLIYDLQNNLYQLYALEADPWEKQNLASKDPTALAAMREHLDGWLERVMFARDPLYNQAQTKLAGVLLGTRPAPRYPVDGTAVDGERIKILGWEPDPVDATWTPGAKVKVAVFFGVTDRPSGSFKLQLTAWSTETAAFDPRGEIGKKVARSSMRTTAEGYLPTDRWRAGEFIRDTFEFTIPADWVGLPGDGIGLAVQLQGPDGKIEATGQVSSSDSHQAILGVAPLMKPSNDAGVPSQGTNPPAGP